MGIGGYGTQNLWQAGTETDPAEGYRFWWEDYPAKPQQYYGPSVGCGNHVAVQVDYNREYANQSYFYMSNYSNNQYASGHIGFKPNSNSAEWIDERTSRVSGCPYELANFGHTDWSYSQAESTLYGNRLLPISSYSYDFLDMYNNPPGDYTLLAASPFGLNSDGKSFTDQWYNFGTQPC